MQLHVGMGVHGGGRGVHTLVCMHICTHVIPASAAALALGSHLAGCLHQGSLR